MTDADTPPETPVLVRASGGVGHLILNRPRALNALSLDMIGDLAAALEAWEQDSGIDMVLLEGAGERGLCAGGDVRALYEQIRGADPEDVAGFFRAEYALNARIADYAKPIVVFADGVTMGGGIGLAGHAAIRIVTERSVLAMPETRIGFTPDVGGTWLLAHAPGRLGEYLALTGAAVGAADAIEIGLADHFVPAADLAHLREQLQTGTGTASERVRAFLTGSAGQGSAPPATLPAAREWIDDAFAADSVAEIIARLQARPEAAASAAAQTLRELSPTALAVTLEAVRRARSLPDLRAALAQEYGLVMWFATSQPDLVEGIRAQLVDKDRAPRWQPPTIEELAPDAAASAFAYTPRVPLWGPAGS